MNTQHKSARKLWLLAVMFLVSYGVCPDVQGQQWNGPDGNGNISSANSGSVGVGTTSPNKSGVSKAITVNGATGAIYELAIGDVRKSTMYHDGTVLSITNNANGAMTLGTNNGEKMRIDSSGNVGIGTSSPTHKLVVGSGTTTNLNSNFGVVTVGPDQAGFAAASGSQRTAYLFSYSAGSLYGLNAYDYGSSVYLPVTINWGGTNTLLNTAGGKVGIGTTTPAEVLDVAGNIKASGTIFAKYQDVAEWVPSSEKLAAGTVVVLDTTKSNQVVASSTAYDTRVAGVISAQPGITLGEKTDDKVLVATTGRVRVMVDATKGPINIGDLLVTSDTPGVAMKSEPIVIKGRKIHAPGTIIGKALEPLAKGKGEILVLLSLQ